MIDLQQFCGTDSTRAKLAAPFPDGEFTYATDGRIIVRVSALDYPSLSESNAPRNVATIQKWNHPAITDWRDLPPGLPEDDWRECKTCKGLGDHYCETCEDWHDCGKCDGAGRKYHIIGIAVGASKIDAKYLRKIATLPDAKIENPSEPNDAVAFKFTGGVGYVMPVRT